MQTNEQPKGLIAGIVATFLTGRLAILFIAVAASLGVAAVMMTPREEEPQIVVPMADIHVSFPGASADEMERFVATPLERLLWHIDGVEHVYSMSRRDHAVVTVRFFVGEDRERSLVKLQSKIGAHITQAPPGVSGWVVRPIEIDDVPIVTLTLTSTVYDDYELRRVGEEVLARLDGIDNVSRTRIVGGRAREVRVELDPEEMRARKITVLDVERALVGADASLSVGGFDRNNRRIDVQSGPFLKTVEDVSGLVVGLHGGRPVYISDFAEVTAGPAETTHYTRTGIGLAGGGDSRGTMRPSVTLAVSKKQGTNAVSVAQSVLDKMDALKRDVIPSDIDVIVTRDYGATADDKVDELLFSLLFAMVSVVGLLIFTLGWREGLIVALAVPISFSLALFVNGLSGYTINRVTLFALILTLGLVVDDPITNVDNIQRHILAGKRKPYFATLWAVREVLPPVIMSTLTIIVSFLPLFFITGMMGPYMEPMAINVPLTVIFSTIAALTIVPWASYHLLKRRAPKEGTLPATSSTQAVKRGWMLRGYERLMRPFMEHQLMRLGLIGVIVLLLMGSGLLVLTRQVPMKMLPFDNKNELQLVIDMPEDTPLEAMDAVVREFEQYLFSVPEVTNFQSYTGTSSPMDFNGLVRHYYFRSEPHLADIRINLAPKDIRTQQNHEIGLRIRNDLTQIAEPYGATIAIVESPPGPPVLATLVAEIRSSPDKAYSDLIAAGKIVAARMATIPAVVDINETAESDRNRIDYVLNKEKAGLHGIDTLSVVRTLRMALQGHAPVTVHQQGERKPLNVNIQFPRAKRSGISELSQITLRGSSGDLVPLGEIGSFTEMPQEQPIYHKDLERVVFVYGDTAGLAPAEAIIDLGSSFKIDPLPDGIDLEWAGEGEWGITLTVFRDLGLAFGAAMIFIYLLLVIQTSSFVMPLVIMTAIPLTAIGIIPGFWLLNLIMDTPIGGYANPVFFTATAMIGMIALGGIVVRNSIVLIEFIQDAVKNGAPLRQAIVQSGAVRMRPILLTAATTALGAWPITLDPIFSGLAWALIFGLFASTAFSLVLVPVMYAMIYSNSSLTKGAVT